MPTTYQFRRRIQSLAEAFTGQVGEIMVDLTQKTLRVHDNIQQGGFPLARADMTNGALATSAAKGLLSAAQFAQLESQTAQIAANVQSISALNAAIQTETVARQIINTVFAGDFIQNLVVEQFSGAANFSTIGTTTIRTVPFTRVSLGDILVWCAIPYAVTGGTGVGGVEAIQFTLTGESARVVPQKRYDDTTEFSAAIMQGMTYWPNVSTGSKNLSVVARRSGSTPGTLNIRVPPLAADVGGLGTDDQYFGTIVIAEIKTGIS